jgi:hypothetical protein
MRTKVMEKPLVRAAVRCLLVAAFLLLAGGLARADDFDGTWIMNANGWTFTLTLKQNGDAVTGTMKGINNDQTSTLEGKIRANEITFKRDNDQEYRGYLFVDDPTGKTNKLTMAGVFKSGDDHAGWYARR